MQYDSYAQFYVQAYGDYITELLPAGRLGATLLRSDQTAGDWSDAAQPDLVITELVTRYLQMTADVGAGRFTVQMHAHDFAVVPPNTDTSFWMDDPHEIRTLAVPYRGLLALVGYDGPAPLPASGDFGSLHQGVQRDPRMNRLLDALWAEAADGSPYGALRADGLMLQVAGLLIELVSRPQASRRALLSAAQLRRVHDYMEAHLGDDIGLQELASVVHLSPSHFCRAFGATTGQSPLKCLTAKRVVLAQRLLRDTALSVLEIAQHCGYAHGGHLAKVFRRATNATPEAWRRQASV